MPQATTIPVAEDVELEAPVEEARSRKDMARPYAPTVRVFTQGPRDFHQGTS